MARIIIHLPKIGRQAWEGGEEEMEGKKKARMFLNLTYVPTHWTLESKALGCILTSDHVASTDDCK